MMRAWFGVSAGALAFGALGCDGGSSRPASPTDPCLVTDCSDGSAPLVDASVDAGKPTRDASVVGDDASSGAVFGFDGSRPPYDGGTGVPIRDAAWEDGGVVGPGGPVLPGDPPNRAICSNAGPIGFSTRNLAATAGARGTGSPDAGPSSDPFTRAWAAASTRTGGPGPALLVLDTLGLLPDGGTRALRIGAPRTDAATGAFGFLQVAQNPLPTTWAVFNTYVVAADSTAAAAPAAKLRFGTASGSSVDIPFAAAKLDARFAIDQGTEACTALTVSALELYVPTTAGSTLFEGQTLSAWLGDGNAVLGSQQGYWRITLRGTASTVSLVGNP
jgi:hypothetical protein